MEAEAFSIVCDGCGLPASPEHIAARMERLELVTRFRPIHIHLLFVAFDPMPRLEDDFYKKAESTGRDAGPAMLLEFQRRGYYLTYLSECPVTPEHFANVEVTRGMTNLGIAHRAADSGIDGAQVGNARECISRLAPTLIKRIRFNYRPKHVVLLGTHLSPLIGVFEDAGLGPLLLLDRGAPLTIPGTGDGSSLTLFRRAVNIETPFATTSSGL